MSLIIDALAPSFGGAKGKVQAFKVAAYSSTAAWLAGFFGIIPMLGILAIVGLYSFYLLYLGLPRLMRCPQDKALGYVIVTVLATIVLYVVIGVVVSSVMMIGRVGTLGAMGALGSPRASTLTGTVAVPGMGSVDMGKLQAASQQMQAAAQQASGQAVAGGAAGAGRAVQPVAADVLQGLLPADINGYARSEVSSSSGGVAGLSGSSAEAHYAKDGANFSLQVTDMGSAAGIAGLVGAINVQSSKQTATGYEKVGKVDGRMTTEEWDSQSHSGKFGVMVADRFMVEAQGSGASIDELKQAVGAVGIGRLESLARG
jgi:hypothetical protein